MACAATSDAAEVPPDGASWQDGVGSATNEPVGARGPVGEYVRRLMADVTARNANEPEFLQAVREAAASIELCVDRFPVYREAKVLERFVEPERVVTFRVSGSTTAARCK